jgi:ElaB/YqjD/DUF883 family membrane-anchored ribosome-binding protein
MQDTYIREKQLDSSFKEKKDDVSKSIEQNEERLKNAAWDVQKQLKQGQEQVQQLISQADKQLHENPWPVVAGVAVSCLFLGFIVGTGRSRN